ncbi:10685_t:CDS:2 [Diversispora eburnea]|uniref:10685_t:CDS:1 n=2 Tax=Diversisporales TaxID=214509 RepID=A0A9N8WMI7_9GLOM|nr:10685_t:CDS:2 [Diversispora eburnea]
MSNNILFITGHPSFSNPNIDLKKSKHLKVRTYDDYEISVPRDEIDFNDNLKTLIEFNPDYVLITFKENLIIEALQKVAELDGKTVIVTTNGYNAPEFVRVALPNTKVIEGIIMQSISTVENSINSEFIQECEGCIYLQSSVETPLIHQILQQSMLTTHTCNNVKSLIYGKLLLSLAHPLVALSDQSLQKLIQNKNWRRLLALLMWEALKVFNNNGIVPSVLSHLNICNLELSTLNSSLPLYLTPYLLLTPNWILKPMLNNFYDFLNVESHPVLKMSDDFKSGRKTEIEELQGEIIKLANNNKLIKPKYNEGIYQLVKLVEKSMFDTQEGWKIAFTYEEVMAYIDHGEISKVLF